jgi:hypothetical protein
LLKTTCSKSSNTEISNSTSHSKSSSSSRSHSKNSSSSSSSSSSSGFSSKCIPENEKYCPAQLSVAKNTSRKPASQGFNNNQWYINKTNKH